MHATRPINRVTEPGTTISNDIDRHVGNARRIRAEALGRAGRRFGRALRTLCRGLRLRLDRWAAERSLALLSDRSLADIGIPRHAIRQAVRGQPWDVVEHSAPARARRQPPLGQRIELWRERQDRRQRMVRELDAYSDRDLEELGIFRSDIPRLAKMAA